MTLSVQDKLALIREYKSSGGKGHYLNLFKQYEDGGQFQDDGEITTPNRYVPERAAQLKDYIAQKNNIPLNKDFTVTTAQLDDAIKNYVKDTGLDNDMSKLLNSLKNKKAFLNNMNKYALGTTGVIGAGSKISNND